MVPHYLEEQVASAQVLAFTEFWDVTANANAISNKTDKASLQLWHI